MFGWREFFSASLSAIILTLPLILWHFGQISLVAPFANILVLPLIPYAMTLALTGAFLGFMSHWLAFLVAFPAWALSFVMLKIVVLFGSIPFASLSFVHSRLVAGIIAFLLFFFWFYHHTYVSRQT